MKLASFSPLLIVALSNLPFNQAAPTKDGNGIAPRQGLGGLIGGLLPGGLPGGLVPGSGGAQSPDNDAANGDADIPSNDGNPSDTKHKIAARQGLGLEGVFGSLGGLVPGLGGTQSPDNDAANGDADIPSNDGSPSDTRHKIAARQLEGVIGGLGGLVPGLGGTQSPDNDAANGDADIPSNDGSPLDTDLPLSDAIPLDTRHKIAARQLEGVIGGLGGLVPGLGGTQSPDNDAANGDADIPSNDGSPLDTDLPLTDAIPLDTRHKIAARQLEGVLGHLSGGSGRTKLRRSNAANAPRANSPCQVMLYEEIEWIGDYFQTDFFGGRCTTLPEEWHDRVRSVEIEGDCLCQLHQVPCSEENGEDYPPIREPGIGNLGDMDRKAVAVSCYESSAVPV